MSEEILIRQGAPPLAGIKTGSLFPCPCEDREDLLADIRRLNRLLVPKGLCLLPIRFLEGQALLYLYRPAGLRRRVFRIHSIDLCVQIVKTGVWYSMKKAIFSCKRILYFIKYALNTPSSVGKYLLTFGPPAAAAPGKYSAPAAAPAPAGA